MIQDADILKGVFEGFRALYDKQFALAPPFNFAPYVVDVPATTYLMNYDWLTDIPAMKPWVGNKKLRDSISAHVYTVKSIMYEATLVVEKRDIETDQLGIYTPQVAMLSEEAKNHRLRLFAECMEANANTFDGVGLFSTAHPKDRTDPAGASTYSNWGSGALSLTALQTARTQMRKLTDAEGRLLGIMPDTLMVPVDLEDLANRLVYTTGPNQSFPGSAINDINPIQRWGMGVVTNPYLSDANNWYLIDTGKPIKPYIYQHRVDPHLVPLIDPSSEPVFMRNQFLYSVEADYTFVPGFPQVIYGSIVAT